MKDLERLPLPENEGKSAGRYVQDVIHEQALKFIEANKDRPFFAYLPYIMPHVELRRSARGPPRVRRQVPKDRPARPAGRAISAPTTPTPSSPAW